MGCELRMIRSGGRKGGFEERAGLGEDAGVYSASGRRRDAFCVFWAELLSEPCLHGAVKLEEAELCVAGREGGVDDVREAAGGPVSVSSCRRFEIATARMDAPRTW